MDRLRDDFKDSKTLLDEIRAKGDRGRRELPLPEASNRGMRARGTPRNTSQSLCEYYSINGCLASQEAVELGLADEVFMCQGLIPPICSIRHALTLGKTISDLYKKV